LSLPDRITNDALLSQSFHLTKVHIKLKITYEIKYKAFKLPLSYQIMSFEKKDKKSQVTKVLKKHLNLYNILKLPNCSYCKVASSNTSRLEAHEGFFRLLMKGIFYPYLL
jgi:hypothetical protein